MPFLIPLEPDEFWSKVRLIIREEVERANKNKPAASTQFETPGLTYKPLFKIAEVCALFQITKPTIYEWIKLEKLKPFKIRSRVYFLYNDIQKLLDGSGVDEARQAK
jgi:predicted DNA-binding transcriptional regulator AlpA